LGCPSGSAKAGGLQREEQHRGKCWVAEVLVARHDSAWAFEPQKCWGNQQMGKPRLIKHVRSM